MRFPIHATLAALALVLAGLVLAGCARKPAHSPSEFVGKWAKPAPSNELMIQLNSDGTGTSKLNWYPHDQVIRWTLVSNEVVFSSMDGSGTDRYTYRFDGPDKLVLVVDGKDQTFQKVK